MPPKRSEPPLYTVTLHCRYIHTRLVMIQDDSRGNRKNTSEHIPQERRARFTIQYGTVIRSRHDHHPMRTSRDKTHCRDVNRVAVPAASHTKRPPYISLVSSRRTKSTLRSRARHSTTVHDPVHRAARGAHRIVGKPPHVESSANRITRRITPSRMWTRTTKK